MAQSPARTSKAFSDALYRYKENYPGRGEASRMVAERYGVSRSTAQRWLRGAQVPRVEKQREVIRRAPRAKSLHWIVSQLHDRRLAPTPYEIEAMIEQFGSVGTKAILGEQLKHMREYERSVTRPEPSWYYDAGPKMMRHYNKEGLFDPMQFQKQLWYFGSNT